MDKQIPPNYYRPSRVLDQAKLQINLHIKIGLPNGLNDNGINEFLKDFDNHLLQLGLEVVNKECYVMMVESYCGSLREKLIEDENCRDNDREPKEDY